MAKKIFFIGINRVTLPFVDYVAEREEVYVSNVTKIVNSQSKFTFFETPHAFFGVDKIAGNLFNSQISFPYYQKKLGQLLKKVEPDVIVCMDFFRFWFLQALWYKINHPKTKLIIHSETKMAPQSFVSEFMFSGMRMMFKFFHTSISRVIVYCQLGKTYFEQTSKVPVTICPAPIDHNLFYSLDSRMPLVNDCLCIMVNSRFVPYKKHIDVLKAMAVLKKEGKKISATFIGHTTDYSKYLEEEVKNLNLSDNVAFQSGVTQDTLRTIYNTHDVLILPSFNDAIGMVVPEALACGTPCIVSDTCGAAVYVKDGVNGYIFETGNIEELAECLRKINTVEEVHRLSKNAEELMKTEFVADKLNNEFYNTIVN